jgi:hypothetical protein
MKLSLIGRVAGALALTLSLAGCFDMTTDILVESPTNAKATITETMGADIYAMIKAADASSSDPNASSEDSSDSTSKPFCKEQGSVLTENADGSATCTITSEGTFEALNFSDGGGKPTFTANPDGTVRVAIQTKGMMGDLGTESDPKTAAMMKQLFDGHFLTIRFGGSEVVDTNLTKTADNKYAEIKIPFTDLLSGTAKLPDELYAVVKP